MITPFSHKIKNNLSKLLLIDLAENLLNIVPKGTQDNEYFIEPDVLFGLLEKNNLKVTNFPVELFIIRLLRK